MAESPFLTGDAWPTPGSSPLNELEEHIECEEYDEALIRASNRTKELVPRGTKFHGGPPEVWELGTAAETWRRAAAKVERRSKTKDGKKRKKKVPDGGGNEDPDRPMGRMTPLHVALDNVRTPPDFVRSLLLASPCLIRAVDEVGALPLHYACSRSHCYGDEGEAFVRMLLALYPEAPVVVERTENATPVHFVAGLTGAVRPGTVKALLDAAYESGEYERRSPPPPVPDRPCPRGGILSDEATTNPPPSVASRNVPGATGTADVASAKMDREGFPPAPCTAAATGFLEPKDAEPSCAAAARTTAGTGFDADVGADATPATTARKDVPPMACQGDVVALFTKGSISNRSGGNDFDSDVVFGRALPTSTLAHADEADRKPAARERSNDDVAKGSPPLPSACIVARDDPAPIAEISDKPAPPTAAGKKCDALGEDVSASGAKIEEGLTFAISENGAIEKNDQKERAQASYAAALDKIIGGGAGSSVGDPAPDLAAASLAQAPTQVPNPAAPVGNDSIQYLKSQCMLMMMLQGIDNDAAGSGATAEASSGASAAPNEVTAWPQERGQPPAVAEAGSSALGARLEIIFAALTGTSSPAAGTLLQSDQLSVINLFLSLGGFERLHQISMLLQQPQQHPTLDPSTPAEEDVLGSSALGSLLSLPRVVLDGGHRQTQSQQSLSPADTARQVQVQHPTKTRSAASEAGGILCLQDRFKRTPLHRACARPYTGGDVAKFDSFEEIIRTMLDEASYPGAKSAARLLDRRGRLPLHHALDLVSSTRVEERRAERAMHHRNAISSLLDAYPGGAAVPDGVTGLNPVHLAYVSASPRDRRLRFDGAFHVMWTDHAACCAKELWETIKALLLAMADEREGKETASRAADAAAEEGGSLSSKDGRRRPPRRRRFVLHAAVRFPCPPRVVREALRLHGRQAHQRDGAGDLPLHAAARRREGIPGAADDRHPWLPKTFVSPPEGSRGHVCPGAITYARFLAEEKEEAERSREDSGDSVIDDLLMVLNKFPRAASFLDRDWRLPLNLAIESGRSWVSGGIEAVANAAPLSLMTRDTKSRLYPFMLAAIDSNNDLTTVFELLKLAPSALQGGLPRENGFRNEYGRSKRHNTSDGAPFGQAGKKGRFV